jgi:hypothetical protein
VERMLAAAYTATKQKSAATTINISSPNAMTVGVNHHHSCTRAPEILRVAGREPHAERGTHLPIRPFSLNLSHFVAALPERCWVPKFIWECRSKLRNLLFSIICIAWVIIRSIKSRRWNATKGNQCSSPHARQAELIKLMSAKQTLRTCIQRFPVHGDPCDMSHAAHMRSYGADPWGFLI